MTERLLNWPNERFITRTAAATTEQVILASRGRLHGVVPEPATAAGTITVRDDNTAGPLTPTTPGGTGSASGGGLAAATYYAKIVAVDRWGEFSLPSTEVNSGALGGVNVNHFAITWDAMDNAVSYRIFFGTASGVLPKYFESTTNSFDLTTTTGQLTATIPAARTAGTARTRIYCAIGLAAAGKDPEGAVFERGIVVQLSNAADRVAIIYEAF